MTSEEDSTQPLQKSDIDASLNSGNERSVPAETIVEAEFASDDQANDSTDQKSDSTVSEATLVDENQVPAPVMAYGMAAGESAQLENIAAKGGAVGAFVLGLLAVVGSFITSYSIINAVLGLLLGLWGLRSRHKKLAVIGIMLAMVGMIFSAVQINDLIQWWLQVRAESIEPDF